MPSKEQSVKCWYTVYSCACVGVSRTELDAALAALIVVSSVERSGCCFPDGGGAGSTELRSEGNSYGSTDMVGWYTV